jgi:hypothetical protein
MLNISQEDLEMHVREIKTAGMHSISFVGQVGTALVL